VEDEVVSWFMAETPCSVIEPWTALDRDSMLGETVSAKLLEDLTERQAWIMFSPSGQCRV
jgi:hypothetical protein